MYYSVTAPATLNGDVISKAQFEALRHAMQQLEVCLAFFFPRMLFRGPCTPSTNFVPPSHPLGRKYKDLLVPFQGKFSKAMRDKADLTDKSEQLEHIIMQLQGETDTIGMFVEKIE